MNRQLLTFALMVSGFLASAGSAPAQIWVQPYPYPIYQNPWYVRPAIAPTWNNGGIQYLGTLPNGTQVFNPWNMYQNNNYSGQVPYWNNPAFRFRYTYSFGPYGTYTAAGSVGYGAANIVGVERELGRFVPVARDTAVNPITGTVLRPWSGVAYTNEGTFYLLPGSGSITAWGAYIPGSGAYLNPITGTLYNPATGLIVRR